ncbi:hypothetical protein AMTRI_Chr08g207360 [Amborella trichopoda]
MGGGGCLEEDEEEEEEEKRKGEISAHPLFDALVAAHTACLRVAAPLHLRPLLRCNSTTLRSHHPHSQPPNYELDQFLVEYVCLLGRLKEELEEHVRLHALQALMDCWEIERSFQALTGIKIREGTGATMSDEEDEFETESNQGTSESSAGGQDTFGFGRLLPTESERTLMERVRQELKIELKQGYKLKLEKVRDEILRKRKAGKLPNDMTSVLKNWWQQHSRWPYPTEDEKAMLVDKTGLQLKQINNWFINHRKRNWHCDLPSETSPKSKTKR